MESDQAQEISKKAEELEKLVAKCALETSKKAVEFENLVSKGALETSKKAEELENLVSKGALENLVSKLSGSSRGIPSDREFHFFNNFPEFKAPIKETDEKSKQFMKRIGAASELWGKESPFREDFNDMGVEANEWLADANDEILERSDFSIDEFRRIRKNEEESGVRVMKYGGVGDDDGEGAFQVVCGKKNRKGGNGGGAGNSSGVEKSEEGGSKVQIATKVRQKVPFHIPSIPKPQDQYKIIVNNSNQPFQHVWLQRSEDGLRFIHPLEEFSPSDFVDKSIDIFKPVEPPPIEVTPFMLVEEVKDLKVLVAKLKNADEFAVDLEHNQYRSFQGLTCLMQISTRTEDFIVDTLKLRIQIGPYMREVFKDPTKRKVMHGADRDILWLQRDFGIYICNLFDTFQASKVLKLERNSLEYLLHHFCGVTANKEYQNADWRLRPLPNEMLRYAREDTHYLLYIYDLMRMRLLALDAKSEHSGTSLLEVYKHSYDTCMQLYEKEVLTDTSYQNIYGMQGAGLNAKQLAVAAALCEWRDVVARCEDESTGFILPNKTLIEIAKEIPLTTSALRLLLKSKHPYIERNLASVVSIIKHSIQNYSFFEAAAETLKVPFCKETGSKRIAANIESSEGLPLVSLSELKAAVEPGCTDTSTSAKLACVHQEEVSGDFYSVVGGGKGSPQISSHNPGENGNVMSETDGCVAAVSKESVTMCEQSRETHNKIGLTHTAAVTVQLSKKPNGAFGALLGNSAKRKYQSDKRELEQMKLEQIKSSVNLPFKAFLAHGDPATEQPAKPSLEISLPGEPMPDPCSNVEDINLLGSDEEPTNGASKTAENDMDQMKNEGAVSALEIDEEDETMSLSDLSSSFQKCFQSINETRRANLSEKSQKLEALFQLKPFDYEAAIKQVQFGKDSRERFGEGDDKDSRSRNGKGRRKSSSVLDQSQKDEMTSDLPQGKRRQAFPASGNRSSTFR